jgi:hypothetical protein
MTGSRFLGVVVRRDVDVVYAYVADPRHLPAWASGLGGSVSRDGDAWVVQTPDGPAALRFAPPNAFGVLDHWVTPPGSQEPVYVPLRVIAHDAGAEVVFVLRPAPGMTEAELERDAAAVRADLDRLRTILEAG